MKTKFTPRPWHMSHQDPFASKAIIFDDEITVKKARLMKHIATVEVRNVNIEDTEGLANARLIAKAPEMYELINNHINGLDVFDAMVALLAEIDGEIWVDELPPKQPPYLG